MNSPHYHCIKPFLWLARIVEMHVGNVFSSSVDTGRKALRILWVLLFARRDVDKGDIFCMNSFYVEL